MEKKSKASLVRQYVESKLMYLGNIADTGRGKAMLANLRRGIGKSPGDLPELWGVIFDGLPEELMGKGKASGAEWAVYTALTLYAMHRQGSDKEVHTKDVSIGAASVKLIKDEDDRDRILNRLNLVVTSNSFEDLAYHLRGLVQLLKNDGIALDYAKLARDLYLFNIPERADEVKLHWGRDFYYKKEKDNEEKGE